jgi:hypothetical protein
MKPSACAASSADVILSGCKFAYSIIMLTRSLAWDCLEEYPDAPNVTKAIRTQQEKMSRTLDINSRDYQQNSRQTGVWVGQHFPSRKGTARTLFKHHRDIETPHSKNEHTLDSECECESCK